MRTNTSTLYFVTLRVIGVFLRKENAVSNAAATHDASLSDLRQPANKDAWQRLSSVFWAFMNSRAGRLAGGVAVMGAAEGVRGADPFVPNDPYYNNSPTGVSQWYLDKANGASVGATVDINIKQAWQNGWTGQGVTIGIVDVGTQWAHPDLQANYKASDSWDFYQNDADPSPATNPHGTECAGLMSARGGNGVGITGVAPLSQFAAQRINTALDVSNNAMILNAVNAIEYHSLAGSRTIDVKNLSMVEGSAFAMLSYPGVSQIESAIKNATAAGTIIVQPAGNERATHGVVQGRDADINKKFATHLPEALNVAAVNSDGRFAEYSNFGSNMVAAAPSGSKVGSGTAGVRVLTTDIMGSAGANTAQGDTFPNQDYASNFSGTSAAGPIMAGALAVAKQAHLETFGVDGFNTRYAKHLLAKTCKVIDGSDTTAMGGWVTNAAGNRFNNNYGFGLLDAGALADAATKYSGVTDLVTQSSGLISAGNAIIPIGNATGVTKSAFMNDTGSLEEVCLRLLFPGDYFSGTSYGQLQVELFSPSGTRSLLSFANPLADSIYNPSTHRPVPLDWIFTSNAFWGESPLGQWSVRVSHPLPSNGTYDTEYNWTGFELTTRSGELIGVPEPDMITLAALGAAGLLPRRRRGNLA